MKLLFDQNVSPRLARSFEAAYPGTAHVRDFEMQAASDAEIWRFAQSDGFVVVSKDSDFRQMSFLFGPPPKVIWVRLGNCSTNEIADSIRGHVDRIEGFVEDEVTALLVLV